MVDIGVGGGTWCGDLELLADEPAFIGVARVDVFSRAKLLARAQGTPIAFLDVDLAETDGLIDASALRSQALAQYRERIERALADLQMAAGSRGGFQTAAGSRGGEAESISVIVCTHDRATRLAGCLKQLRQLQSPGLEFVIVDNCPTDDSTRAVVRELAATDPRFRYTVEPRQGLAVARNHGVSMAAGEIVAFTDDDVTVDPVWLDGLRLGFSRSPRVACVTGLVASASLEHPAERYFDSRVWWASNCEPSLYSAERGDGDSALHPFAPGKIGTGANFAMRRDVLDALGGFDEAFGAGSATQGGEDLDIFVRLLLAGHDISYEPRALVRHHHRVDEAALRRQMYAYGRGLSAYLTKYLLADETRSALLRRSFAAAGHGKRLLARPSAETDGEGTPPRWDLVRAELSGFMSGPYAYGRARRQVVRVGHGGQGGRLGQGDRVGHVGQVGRGAEHERGQL